MKLLIVLAMFSFAFIQTNAQTNQPDLYLTKSLASEDIQFVEASTSGGSIKVEGVPSNEARLEIYIRSNNGKTLSKEEIESRLNANYDLKVDVASQKLSVITKTKNRWSGKNALSISYRIFIPKNTTTNLQTSGGSISLDNLSGNQDFQTSGGSLSVNNVSGRINGQTSGGSISLKNSSDEIRLVTSGGSIKAENCKGNIRLVTSGGSLKLNDLNGNISASTSGGSVEANNITGDLVAKTSGGSVRMNGLACNLETATAGGSIDVAFLKPVKSIKVSNSAGNVRLQLPGNQGLDLSLSGSKINTGNLKNFSGSVDKNSVDGKLNGGGNDVYVSAGSGTITLNLVD